MGEAAVGRSGKSQSAADWEWEWQFRTRLDRVIAGR